MLPVLVLLAVLSTAWYVLIVRPQRSQQGRHQSLLGQLKPGDHVMTVGGLYGRVEALDGDAVVLELAPGMTTRVATAGIARIVAGEQQAPQRQPMTAAHAQVQANTPTQWQDMNQTPQHHQHPQHDQQGVAYGHGQPQVAGQHQQYAQAPHYAQAPQQQQQYAPQVQYAQQPHPAPGQPQFAPQQQLAPHQPVVVMQQPPQQFAPAHGHDVHFRAGAAPTQQRPPMLQVEPSPWANAPSPFTQPQMHPQQPPAQMAPLMQVQHQAPVQHYAAPLPQHAGPPQQFQLQPVTPHAQVSYVHPQQHVPQHAAPHPHAPVAQYAPEAGYAPVGTLDPVERERRHSRAPKGMGQSARIEGELAQAFERARGERSELADEYRRVVAPLVHPGDDGAQGHEQVAQTLVMHGQQPGSVPLFVAPGHAAPHGGAQYPAPAQLPTAHGVPRPGIVPRAPEGSDAEAFQRPSPYAPAQALATGA